MPSFLTHRRHPGRLLLATCAPLMFIVLALAATRAPAQAADTLSPRAPAGGGYITIAAGSRHSCGLTAAGAVQCWGDNSWGELGDGTTMPRLLPVDVVGLDVSVTAIAAGEDFSCAILNGGARCWGRNTSGQLGDGGGEPSASTPLSLSALSSGVDQISAGFGFACAVVNGRAECWGDNSQGQLGSAGPVTSSVPVTVTGLVSGVTSIAAGGGQSCAVVNGGALCWGANNNGQLGNGSLISSAVPVSVSGLASGVTAIAAGGSHSCALANGGALCWGSNFHDELGADSIVASSTTPLAVSGLLSGVSSIVAGSASTCAVANGGALCWGYGNVGQLGIGTQEGSPVPAAVAGLGSGVTALAAGAIHACAVVSGTTRCWGWNQYGQLGDGAIANRYLPVQTGVIATPVAEGFYHTCALNVDAVRCWGHNYDGELGNDSIGIQTVPTDVAGLSSGVSAVAAGDHFSCALVSGAVRCWGLNDEGQLGNGSLLSSIVPVTVSGLLSGVRAITAGAGHACALVNGGAQCWGANGSGQLGNNSTAMFSNVPVGVSGLVSGVTALAAGGSHTCAIAKGSVVCWGSNHFGQLGNGSLGDSRVPVNVAGLSGTPAALAAGGMHTCALLMAGSLWCWGDNATSQLGPGGPPASSTVPIPVSGLGSSAVAVSAGLDHTCALLRTGGVQCWGADYYGQLGDNGTGVRAAPADVINLTFDIGALGPARAAHTCAVTRGGGLWCWGENHDGQLGNGDTILQTIAQGVACSCDCHDPTCCAVSTACSCPRPDHFGGLAPAVASSFAPMPFDIRTYYAVRDGLLARTSAGRRYIDLYNTQDTAIRTALLTHPTLMAEGLALLQEWQPLLQALVDGHGGGITISAQQVQAVKQFLNDLSADGSPALKQAIAAELARTPLDPLAGQTVEQARAGLVGYPPLYLPLILR